MCRHAARFENSFVLYSFLLLGMLPFLKTRWGFRKRNWHAARFENWQYLLQNGPACCSIGNFSVDLEMYQRGMHDRALCVPTHVHACCENKRVGTCLNPIQFSASSVGCANR